MYSRAALFWQQSMVGLCSIYSLLLSEICRRNRDHSARSIRGTFKSLLTVVQVKSSRTISSTHALQYANGFDVLAVDNGGQIQLIINQLNHTGHGANWTVEHCWVDNVAIVGCKCSHFPSKMVLIFVPLVKLNCVLFGWENGNLNCLYIMTANDVRWQLTRQTYFSLSLVYIKSGTAAAAIFWCIQFSRSAFRYSLRPTVRTWRHRPINLSISRGLGSLFHLTGSSLT